MANVQQWRVIETLTDKMLNFISGKIRYTGHQGAIQYIKKNFPSAQYNGAEPWGNIVAWCEEAFGNDYVWDYETFYFKYEKDATLFRLKWAK